MPSHQSAYSPLYTPLSQSQERDTAAPICGVQVMQRTSTAMPALFHGKPQRLRLKHYRWCRQGVHMQCLVINLPIAPLPQSQERDTAAVAPSVVYKACSGHALQCQHCFIANLTGNQKRL